MGITLRFFFCGLVCLLNLFPNKSEVMIPAEEKGEERLGNSRDAAVGVLQMSGG